MKTKLFMLISALMLLISVAEAQRGGRNGNRGNHYKGNRNGNGGYYSNSNYNNGNHYNNCGNHYNKNNYNRGYTVTYGYSTPRYYGWSFYYHPTYRVWVEGYWSVTQDSVQVWIPGYWRWIRY